MSDDLKHECGIALLRLRRGLPYYTKKYGSAYYGFEKLSLLLEKQHNRGQDGAGIACVGLDVPPGNPFYEIQKSCDSPSLANVLEDVGEKISGARQERRHLGLPDDEESIAALDSLSLPFLGELYLGHLRYGTFGGQSVSACHPFVHHSSWPNNTLMIAGNFNLTNTAEIFDSLVASGHHPVNRQDGDVLLTQLMHFLHRLPHGEAGCQTHDIASLLKSAAPAWDGGFVVSGIFGNGDSFALRDAAGIRPAYYYVSDEVVAVASERASIQTSFNLETEEVLELPPGHAIIIQRDGEVSIERILPERELRRCSFERIYFSRGNDADIHRERRAMGAGLFPGIMGAIGGDVANTVFSYIPNTALVAYHGLLNTMMDNHLGMRIRFAQIAVKDAKFRTFIVDAKRRQDLFPHVYDITYGIIRPGVDNLVVIDDSVVRGNTMRNAILPILDRLNPKKIVVASAAPPICYPDCYGIDMASFDQLVAFEAARSLLKKRGELALLDECARHAAEDLRKPDAEMQNCAKPIFAGFTHKELSDEIGLHLRPAGLKAELEVVFQTCEQLRACCPEHTGDWYFTGDYPTPGGNRVVNRAIVNYCSNNKSRAY
jgi:Glutamine phosphoribosylpyrophosphate amidotransferase